MKVIFLLLVCGLAFVSAAPVSFLPCLISHIFLQLIFIQPKTPVSLPLQKDKLMALAAEKGIDQVQTCLDKFDQDLFIF